MCLLHYADREGQNINGRFAKISGQKAVDETRCPLSLLLSPCCELLICTSKSFKIKCRLKLPLKNFGTFLSRLQELLSFASGQKFFKNFEVARTTEERNELRVPFLQIVR